MVGELTGKHPASQRLSVSDTLLHVLKLNLMPLDLRNFIDSAFITVGFGGNAN